MNQNEINMAVNAEDCTVKYVFADKEYLKAHTDLLKEKGIKFSQEQIEDGLTKLEMKFQSLLGIWLFVNEIAPIIITLFEAKIRKYENKKKNGAGI